MKRPSAAVSRLFSMTLNPSQKHHLSKQSLFHGGGGRAGGERESPQITTLAYVSDRAAVSAHTPSPPSRWLETLEPHTRPAASTRPRQDSRQNADANRLKQMQHEADADTCWLLFSSFCHHLIGLVTRRNTMGAKTTRPGAAVP